MNAPAAPHKHLLSEFQAATLVGMSPELLKWFTSYAPKSGQDRKLPIAKKEESVVFYDRDELLAFDDWLRHPWPHPGASRPHIPDGIRAEVKREANGECAICHSYRDSCQAAHIEPVAKSKSNHPENLIWLCSNHHIVYDHGLYYGPKDEDKDFVPAIKTVLLKYQKSHWAIHAKCSEKAFSLLETLSRLGDTMNLATTDEHRNSIRNFTTTAITSLRTLGASDSQDPNLIAYQNISASKTLMALTAGAVTGENLKSTLEAATSVREEYVAELGYVACPVCHATGVHDGEDCPVCGGDRQIDEDNAAEVNVSDYDIIDCPLCRGVGHLDGNDCPECGGDRALQRRFADRINLRDYDKVDCPLCLGSGSREGNDCPVCHADKTLTRQQAEDVRLSDFDKIKCPLCKGSGTHNGTDCPECGGDREMDRHFAEAVDLSAYKKVPCPLCKGQVYRHADECPVCKGDREVDRSFADQVDLRDFEKVLCPKCKGTGQRKGNDCGPCEGTGSLERRFIHN